MPGCSWWDRRSHVWLQRESLSSSNSFRAYLTTICLWAQQSAKHTGRPASRRIDSSRFDSMMGGQALYTKRIRYAYCWPHHVTLLVDDVDKAAAFYGGVLQMTAKPRPAFDFPGLFYRCGQQEIHLIVTPQLPASGELTLRFSDGS